MPKKQGQITPKIDLKFRWFSEISDSRFWAFYGCHTPTPSTSNEIGRNFVELFLLVRGLFPQSLSRFHATFGGYCMPRRKVNFKKWWRCLSRPLLYHWLLPRRKHHRSKSTETRKKWSLHYGKVRRHHPQVSMSHLMERWASNTTPVVSRMRISSIVTKHLVKLVHIQQWTRIGS